ncbi:LacI family DNA-binding transcriptional regulator [Mycoplasmopsis lipofaciens]|uniref:LacI family DNA-binding transcriptional regulator n=1 Tax=Mycoplasmopsis lipofaciens TaxID=114884 RepID=UPI000481BE51|nr:LacI family DNA-binding transcriptional regulator [Mycoplasmopsis lipofaciens]
MKNFSYKDISKLAGVSISTISRYYNGGYVSKATKQKITKIVKEHNYYPNHGARLIRGRDNSIFVIAPEWFESAYTHIMNGIEQGAKLHDKKVLITYSSSNIEEYIESIKYVLSWKPGSVVFFLPSDPSKKIVEYLKQNLGDIPAIIYGQNEELFNCITIDFEDAFEKLTTRFVHFIEKGQKIIYAEDGKLNEEQKEARLSGFKKACKKLNIEYEICTLKNKDPKQIHQFLNNLRLNNHVNVVCSTHEVFVSLISSQDKNLRLTDIGWLSIFDYQHKYKTKIFLDYPEIGLIMEKILFNNIIDGTMESKIIKPRIV